MKTLQIIKDKNRLSKFDIIGHKFHSLYALKLNPNRTKSRQKRYDCVCDCGNKITVTGTALRNGTRTCGCLRVKMLIERASSHGLIKHPLYHRWSSMLSRCGNKNNPRYNSYGGRGINVCDEWKQFENYYTWAMENGWSKDLVIDRKNNNGDYEPNNCRFITAAENNRNMSTSCRWFIHGIKYDSCVLAGKANNVTGGTIIRWCDGYITKGGNFSPPRKGCYKEKVYA